jgi:hypothetical protein
MQNWLHQCAWSKLCVLFQRRGSRAESRGSLQLNYLGKQRHRWIEDKTKEQGLLWPFIFWRSRHGGTASCPLF